MSAAAESVGIGTLALLLASILCVIASIAMVGVLHFIWSGYGGRIYSLRRMIYVSIRRIAVTLATLIVLGIAWRYWHDARLRAACGLQDQMTEYSPDGRYVAKYCYFRDTIILRLYGNDNTRLLAERTYRDTSGVLVGVTWTQNALTYPEGDNLETIKLPPSVYDRMLTLLP
ncbi:hypothetical protein [Burkholderia diffusa]|uniref:hypothetical protein n=1 Tax=Burkholderia diffusa TaxID=488732 RepID=UPI0008413DE5|nr:hypothetical protein [Burkholderia diffusa]AOI58771.1 hypothetical protein WI26_14740 [Burkholderia diffusa]